MYLWRRGVVSSLGLLSDEGDLDAFAGGMHRQLVMWHCPEQ